MSQIFEYTRHSDRYLIHHFSFEGNDDMSIGYFRGNYSMNKFMSLFEWRMIFEHMAKLIKKYLKMPKTKLPNDSIDLTDTNIELNVEWSEMDAAFYGKIFPSINLEIVYPFVMVVKVGYKSNMNKFVPSAGEGSNQIANNDKSERNGPSLVAKISVASSSNTKSSTPKSPKKSAPLVGSNVDITLMKTIGSNDSVGANVTRLFSICLDRLTADEIDRLTGSTSLSNITVPTSGEKKRKHQRFNDSVSTPQKQMSAKRPAPETPFVNSVNSTPYVRLSKIDPNSIETDVSRISAENDKSTKKTKAGPKSTKTKKVNKVDRFNTNLLTKSPLVTKKTVAKSVKNAKPRLQVSIGHLTAKPKKSSKVKKYTHKVKKSKNGSKLVNGESSSLEIIDPNASDPFQQPSTSRASNEKENHPQYNGNPQPIDLKSLTEREVIDEYNRYNVLLTTLFKQNVRQDEIQRAGDYTPIDIITLLTHQQFSFMLDKLYDQFKGYSNEECETIFFDIIIPEWTLAMFMRQTSLERDTAIELINSQKTQKNDNSTLLSYISFKEE